MRSRFVFKNSCSYARLSTQGMLLHVQCTCVYTVVFIFFTGIVSIRCVLDLNVCGFCALIGIIHSREKSNHV